MHENVIATGFHLLLNSYAKFNIGFLRLKVTADKRQSTAQPVSIPSPTPPES